MGVPSFFRWLTKKYPSVIVHCVEDKVVEIDGVKVPVDYTQPNPNGVEFDNLYLDMNGIIHPCTHPENKPAPRNEEEMMIAIFECIDRIFGIVRPRKLLYMAIDGVAPRAKMNQQRSRRFRASKETSEKLNEIERIREEMEARGCLLPPKKDRSEHFDSNCITPGTPFMDRLSKALNYYVHDRLNSDPAWKNIKVILSDASVPGEGEHKIMDFIRRQRAQPHHNPNTSHCLCGADADLIMLGLATHEPNFTIIREEFRPNRNPPCDICGQEGHEMKDCLGLEKECPEDGPEPQPYSELEYIFVRLNVLREYLQKELEMPNLPFTFDLDRAVDDWVFMCFFVGNDFLPHLPSLEIREGAIDRLVRIYKQCIFKTHGWLTEDGVPVLQRVQLILSELGQMEDEIFKNRQNNELRFRARRKAEKRRRLDDSNCYDSPAFISGGSFTPSPLGRNSHSTPNRGNVRNEAFNMRMRGMRTQSPAGAGSNRDAAAALKAQLNSSDSPNRNWKNSSDSSFSSYSSSPGTVSVESSPIIKDRREGLKRKGDMNMLIDSDEDEPNDEVRLWEDGFKDRYYESKFDVLPENVNFRIEVGHQYVKGLCWVLRYYYQGCASWDWYYPYHYAPFASDFINVGDLSTEFERRTKPFTPLEQLMGVFPAGSRSHVPPTWGELMLDPESPIIDFYPEDFQIDLNGKKFAWQGVALLPFVDEVRLKSVLEDHFSELTDEEVRRNTRGDDKLFVRKGHEGYDFLAGLYENEFETDVEVPLDATMFDGVGGLVLVSPEKIPYKGTVVSPLRTKPDIGKNRVILVRYRDLKFGRKHVFYAKRLEGAVDPPKVLKPGDLTPEESRNWRPMIGMAPSTKRASLDVSGHRALNNSLREATDSRNQFRSPSPYNSPRNAFNSPSNWRNSSPYSSPRSHTNGNEFRTPYTPRGGGNNYNRGANRGNNIGYTTGNPYRSNYSYSNTNNSGNQRNTNYNRGGFRNQFRSESGNSYSYSSRQQSSFGFRNPWNSRNNQYASAGQSDADLDNNWRSASSNESQGQGYFSTSYNRNNPNNQR